MQVLGIDVGGSGIKGAPVNTPVVPAQQFNEAGIIPEGITHLWDLNPALNPDGSYPLFHENGLIGGSLKALMGYNGDPSLTEVMAYSGYWIIIGMFVHRTYKTRMGVKDGSRYPQD